MTLVRPIVSAGQFVVQVAKQGGAFAVRASGQIAPRMERPLYFATQLFKVIDRKEWIGIITPYRVMALRFMTLNSIYSGDMKERFSYITHRDFWTSMGAKAMDKRAEFLEGVVWTGNFAIRLIKERSVTTFIISGMGRLGLNEDQQSLFTRGVKILDSVADGPLEVMEKASTIVEFIAAAQAWHNLSATMSPAQKRNSRLKFAYTASRVGGYAVGIVFGAKAVVIVAGISLVLNLARDYHRYKDKKSPQSTVSTSQPKPDSTQELDKSSESAISASALPDSHTPRRPAIHRRPRNAQKRWLNRGYKLHARRNQPRTSKSYRI